MNQTDRSHHTLPGSGLLIDGFRFRAPDVRAYVLSHFHSDHHAGLDAGFPWDNARGAKLWCSPVTAALVVHTLGVDPAHVVAVPFDTPTPLPGTGVTLTLVPANHCPGAAMMLLDTGARRVLHCGDMRFSPAMLANRTLAAARGSGGGGSGSGIDEVLLDTTYAHPRHVFAPQAACIDYVTAVVRAYVQARPQEAVALPPPQPAPEAAAAVAAALQPPPKRRRQAATDDPDAAAGASSSAAAAAAPDVTDAAAADLALAPLQTPSPLAGLDPLTHAADAGSDTLFLVSAYVVGKERILLALARALRLRVYVPRSKLGLVAHLGLLPCDLAWFTDDPTAAAVHVVGMGACGRAWPYFPPAFDGMLRYLAHVNSLHAAAAAGRLPQAHAARHTASAAASGAASSAAVSGDSGRSGADVDDDAAERLLFEESSGGGDDGDAATAAAAAGGASDGAPLRYRRVVGIVPTGWVHSAKKKVYVWPWVPGADEAGDAAAAGGGGGGGKSNGGNKDSGTTATPTTALAAAAAAAGVTAAVHLTPYSEHSSFSELVEFVRYLRPRAVTPTVYADDDDRRKIVERFAHLTDATAAKREFLAKMGGGGSSSGGSGGGGGKAGGSKQPAAAAAVVASSAPSAAAAVAGTPAAAAADTVVLCDDSDEEGDAAGSGGSSRAAAGSASSSSASGTPSRVAGGSGAPSVASPPQVGWWCHSCARGVAVRFKLGAGATRVAACTRCQSEFVERATAAAPPSGAAKR
jgi:hypothetical protein